MYDIGAHTVYMYDIGAHTVYMYDIGAHKCHFTCGAAVFSNGVQPIYSTIDIVLCTAK